VSAEASWRGEAPVTVSIRGLPHVWVNRQIPLTAL
jgi:hypothetical protein